MRNEPGGHPLRTYNAPNNEPRVVLMAKKPKKNKPRPPQSSGFNVPMIRDFLDNLLWELCIVHYEVASVAAPTGPGDDKTGLHPELTEQLKKFMTKYRHAGLLFANAFPKDEQGVTSERKQEAIANYRATRAKEIEALIRHMEALQPLFEEAFKCLANPTRPIVRKRKYSDYLQKEPGDEGGPVIDGSLSDGPVIPINALFAADKEDSFAPNPESDPRQMMHGAELIVGVNVMDQREFLVYGRATLERIAASSHPQPVKIVKIGLDCETDELEKLLALVRVVKGHDDYRPYDPNLPTRE